MWSGLPITRDRYLTHEYMLASQLFPTSCAEGRTSGGTPTPNALGQQLQLTRSRQMQTPPFHGTHPDQL